MTDNEIIKALEWCEQFENNVVFKGSGDEKCVQALQMMVVIKHALRNYNRQKAEIERLEKELKITRAYIHDNGLEWDLLSKNKRAKSKCDCYHTITKRKYTYNPITGQPIGNDIEVGVCWGTKECEECSCKGDESKCDFYPQKRNGR